jgi:hypothetical protein
VRLFPCFRVLSADVVNRSSVDSWVTDDDGGKMERRVWNDLAKRLNAIQPGCI